MRGSIIASPGKVLAVSDLSNIEGRVAAWLAGEEWKLDAFRAYDKGEGPDLYIAAYAKAFRVSTDSVDKQQRQVGKVMELALQYEGGVGAFVTFAMVYRLNLDDLADVAWPVIPEAVKERANANLVWAKKSKRSMLGLSDRTWLVCEALKLLWRDAHPAIGGIWKPLQQACVRAVETKETTILGKMTVQMRGNWLTIKMPSGRSLSYPGPTVSEKGVLSYYGVHQYTRRWQLLSTYGGKIFENATQFVARDVMAANMPRIENAGFDLLLSVHDELITETEDTGQPVDNKLSLLLATRPHWAPDLPLSAGGFTAPRYRKDD
jgi:DNA polymerase